LLIQVSLILTDSKDHVFMHVYTASISAAFLRRLELPDYRSVEAPTIIHHERIAFEPYRSLGGRLSCAIREFENASGWGGVLHQDEEEEMEERREKDDKREAISEGVTNKRKVTRPAGEVRGRRDAKKRKIRLGDCTIDKRTSIGEVSAS
jgi:hypothetical protein